VTRRQLVLIRHAKSADGRIDIERSLTPRGRRDAGAIGQLLAHRGVAPDRGVVSPARRARQTWAGLQSELAAAVEEVVDDRIYDNAFAAVLGVIRDTPDTVQTLALVGHHPSLAELARALEDSKGEYSARRGLLAGYPTGGVAILEMSGPWTELRPHSATLTTFAVPRGGS
jgi:phosphohistidine phosphatase